MLTHSADSGNGDPLFYFGLNWQVWLILLIKCVVAFVALLVATALMIWFERKVISDMQSRVGPNRAGPWGLLQTLADGTKLIFKEDLLPDRADSFVFKLAPYLSVIPAVLVFTVVPVGGVITIGSHTFELQVADPPMGILLVLAMSGIAVYGVMLAGWSSGSKYPLLGSVRASAQVISYEAALGMTTVMVVLVTGSLSTRAIVASQSNGFWNWNLIRLGFLPFIFFMIAITAELTRPPFDLTEADTELVGGFHTEYSSIRFGLFYLAEFMNTITMSAIVVTLFFGGPNGYIFHIPGATIYMPIIYFLLKTVAFCFIYVWFRAALPRLRYDQLMDLGWKRLIPLTLGWLLLVAAIVAWGWAGLILVPVVILASFLLIRANKLGKEISDDDLILPAVGSRVTPPVPAVAGSGSRFRREGLMGVGDELKDQLSFLGGFKLTFQHLTRPRVTTKYPDEKKPKQPRQHGRHVLNRYEDGMEKCIGCELCAGVCPADCIYVRGLDNPPDHPVSPGERYGYVYEINYLRCIHCDMCVEACPTEAITESKLFEFSFTNRFDAIYTKEELVVNDDGTPKKLPWEDWREGDDEMTSGWMRATAPSGSAEYEGEVQWSGELGYGVRAPEGGQSAHRDDDATGTKPLREVLEAHLLDEDIPLAHRGMQGRVWRAKEGAAANRKKMDAMRARMKDLRASRKAAKADAKAERADAAAEKAAEGSVHAAAAITGAVVGRGCRGRRSGAAEGSD